MCYLSQKEKENKQFVLLDQFGRIRSNLFPAKARASMTWKTRLLLSRDFVAAQEQRLQAVIVDRFSNSICVRPILCGHRFRVVAITYAPSLPAILKASRQLRVEGSTLNYSLSPFYCGIRILCGGITASTDFTVAKRPAADYWGRVHIVNRAKVR